MKFGAVTKLKGAVSACFNSTEGLGDRGLPGVVLGDGDGVDLLF